MSFSPPSRSHCFLNTSRHDNRILFRPHNRLKVAWQPIFIPPAPDNKHNCTLFLRSLRYTKTLHPRSAFHPPVSANSSTYLLCWTASAAGFFPCSISRVTQNTVRNRYIKKNLYILWGDILTQGLSWFHQRVHSSVSTNTNSGLVGKQVWGMNKRVLPSQPSRHACTCFFYLLWECSGPCTGFKKKNPDAFFPKPKNEASQQPTWKKQVSFKQETITILPIKIQIFTIAKN